MCRHKASVLAKLGAGTKKQGCRVAIYSRNYSNKGTIGQDNKYTTAWVEWPLMGNRLSVLEPDPGSLR